MMSLPDLCDAHRFTHFLRGERIKFRARNLCLLVKVEQVRMARRGYHRNGYCPDPAIRKILVAYGFGRAQRSRYSKQED
jgi:hypothetical protein